MRSFKEILIKLKKLPGKYSMVKMLSLHFLFLVSILLLLLFKSNQQNSYVYAALNSNDMSNSNPNITELINLDVAVGYTYTLDGNSSWYGKRFNKRKTSSGEKYDMFSFSAAHRKIPFGTILRITNIENHKTIFVRINDRGPFTRNKIIDLSFSSAAAIDAFDNPEVKIDGITDDVKNQFADSKVLYCYAYSFDKPLICIPFSELDIIDSTKNFDNAVMKFIRFGKDNPNQISYLLQPANFGGNDSYYYIACIHTEQKEPNILTIVKNDSGSK